MRKVWVAVIAVVSLVAGFGIGYVVQKPGLDPICLNNIRLNQFGSPESNSGPLLWERPKRVVVCHGNTNSPRNYSFEMKNPGTFIRAVNHLKPNNSKFVSAVLVTPETTVYFEYKNSTEALFFIQQADNLAATTLGSHWVTLPNSLMKQLTRKP